MKDLIKRLKRLFKKEEDHISEIPEKEPKKMSTPGKEPKKVITVENAIFKPGRPRRPRRRRPVKISRKVFRGAVKTAYEKRLWYSNAKLEDD